MTPLEPVRMMRGGVDPRADPYENLWQRGSSECG
jgi:hypothetical protein